MAAHDSPGRYTLRRRIAAGGMGEVYEAEAVGIGGVTKRVAVKLLRPRSGPVEDLTKLFVEEAKLVFTLSHANVVHTFDVGLLDDRYFIAMEYVDGVDLAGMLRYHREERRRPLAPEVAVPIAVEALKGLDYAHRARDAHGLPLGVVHQDVSPSNILLSTEGEVKIADFGVAIRAFRDDPAKGHVRGKYAYMAPEQLAGGDVDARADVFAMGAVLYEALLGERAFGRTALADEARCRAAQKTVADAEDIPAALSSIIARALHHDRTERFRRAADMREALEDAAHQEGIRVTTTKTVDLVRRAHRHVKRQAGAPTGPLTNAEVQRAPRGGLVSHFVTAAAKPIEWARDGGTPPSADATPRTPSGALTPSTPVSGYELRRVPLGGGGEMIIDETRWPLVIVSGTESITLSLDQVTALCEATDELFAREERFAIILDGRGVGMPAAKARNALGEFAKTREHLFERWVVADATVFNNIALRGAVTAVNWMAPPKHPVKTFGDMEHAIAWASELLAAEGLTIAV